MALFTTNGNRRIVCYAMVFTVIWAAMFFVTRFAVLALAQVWSLAWCDEIPPSWGLYVCTMAASCRYEGTPGESDTSLIFIMLTWNLLSIICREYTPIGVYVMSYVPSDHTNISGLFRGYGDNVLRPRSAKQRGPGSLLCASQRIIIEAAARY